MYQMVITYSKCLKNIPSGHKINKYFPIQGPPKFTQIGIFGLKRNPLATLAEPEFFSGAQPVETVAEIRVARCYIFKQKSQFG
jgi:hypothetical protein